MISVRAFDFPILQAQPHPGACVLALIVAATGPSFRPVGATMIVLPDGTRLGALSSGCIDADVALHAQGALARQTPRRLRYGQGSPFLDIQLPCGGALDILLVPVTDRRALDDISLAISGRHETTLAIDAHSGALRTAPAPDADFQLRILPDTRFVVFGKGTEASAFATMAAGAGYDCVLISPDRETLAGAQATLPGLATREITRAEIPADLAIDAHTAVALFFHSHDWEAQIIAQALQTPAFYVGAQGSLRTASNRIETLRAQGVGEADLARIKGPIGVIRSTRDPRTLAVSVLAEILSFEPGTRTP